MGLARAVASFAENSFDTLLDKVFGPLGNAAQTFILIVLIVVVSIPSTIVLVVACHFRKDIGQSYAKPHGAATAEEPDTPSAPRPWIHRLVIK